MLAVDFSSRRNRPARKPFIETEELFMPANRNRRLSPENIQSNRNAVIGVQSLPDYEPNNPAYTAARLVELVGSMDAARQAEMRAVQQLTIARDVAAAAEWALYEGVLGARAQVIAQYGPDSHAVQVIGLKRKSERKRPARKPAAPTT